MSNLYKNVQLFWRERNSPEFKEIQKPRLMQWRREPTSLRIRRPTRIDRARSLGYKAKPGYVIIRTKVRRGSRRMSRPNRGRTGKNMATSDITSGRNLRNIAETRTSRRYTNLEVLGSYWVGQDGRSKWFEVILVDPQHPSITNDHRVSYISLKENRRRVFRGLTSSGKKQRGLRNKGIGAEKSRPSRNRHGNRNK
ncbi:MAG: 50S ribosomal protein L15e [Candidatus Heimdallarchaeota archaeon]|nr:50S ribosomal protein L15e [Candidatus Heimdallarchaeota archaeon]MDH5645871.1 50S ribosomal protein L15e [Candidatus Heimdallarchaeota archaeon]